VPFLLQDVDDKFIDENGEKHGNSCRFYFRNFGAAIVTMFVVMTNDGWSESIVLPCAEVRVRACVACRLAPVSMCVLVHVCVCVRATERERYS
jgi:hypothetical protein